MAEQTPPKEKLVGDLETLVTLLDEGKDPTLDMFADEPMGAAPAVATALENEAQPANATVAQPEPPAPDPVTSSATAPSLAPPSVTSAQNQDLFDALLGTGWEAQSNELLQAASATIQAQKLDWNPEDSEALTEALRVRLEQSINGWLNTTLTEQVELLRQQLLLDLQQELSQRVQSTLHSNQLQRQQKEDGLSQLAEDPAPTGNP